MNTLKMQIGSLVKHSLVVMSAALIVGCGSSTRIVEGQQQTPVAAVGAVSTILETNRLPAEADFFPSVDMIEKQNEVLASEPSAQTAVCQGLFSLDAVSLSQTSFSAVSQCFDVSLSVQNALYTEYVNGSNVMLTVLHKTDSQLECQYFNLDVPAEQFYAVAIAPGDKYRMPRGKIRFENGAMTAHLASVVDSGVSKEGSLSCAPKAVYPSDVGITLKQFVSTMNDMGIEVVLDQTNQ